MENETAISLVAEAWNQGRYSFERDCEVNGGDIVEWLAEFRQRAETVLGGRAAALAIVRGENPPDGLSAARPPESPAMAAGLAAVEAMIPNSESLRQRELLGRCRDFIAAGGTGDDRDELLSDLLDEVGG